MRSETAFAICERIRLQLADLTVMAVSGAPISLTVSIGLGQISGSDRRETLLENADKALYAAKRSGRNRLTLAA